MGNKLTVDFTSGNYASQDLLIGRKNGVNARELLKIKDADSFVFKANETQIITSSFFLGLAGEYLTTLFKKLNDGNKLLSSISFEGFNKISKDECIRGIKRGIINNGNPFL